VSVVVTVSSRQEPELRSRGSITSAAAKGVKMFASVEEALRTLRPGQQITLRTPSGAVNPPVTLEEASAGPAPETLVIRVDAWAEQTTVPLRDIVAVE
jgi:hypothetical protein